MCACEASDVLDVLTQREEEQGELIVAANDGEIEVVTKIKN